MTRFVSLSLLAWATASAAGCGGQDGCQVTGTVTLDGKPLPGGAMLFEPDGFAGPAASLGVVDGRYEVTPAKHLLPGRYTVRVSQPGGRSGETNPISFPTFTTTADVPAGRSERDFDVPGAKAAP